MIFCVNKEMAYEKGGKEGKDVLCYMDVAIAAENVCLAAMELGLGSCIVRSFNKKAIKELFDIALEPELMVALGYPVETPLPPERRRADEVIVYWDEKDG
jgi:nitroreductase